MKSHGWRWAALLSAAVVLTSYGENGGDVTIRYKVDPSSGSILKRREIHVFVRGRLSDLTLKDVELKPSVTLKDARPDLEDALPGKYFDETGPRTDLTEVHLPDNSDLEFIFEYKRGSVWAPLRNPALMTVEPSTQQLTLSAQVKSPVANVNPPLPSLDEPVEFAVTAPSLAVTFGGAVGALALAFLRLVYRLRAGGPKVDWRSEVREGTIAICGGALIAWSLTFLGGLLSDASLGVQISATSFKGGVIIGLLSYKIGDLLAQKLWDKPKPSPG
jgi:hypothetical protein